jgi:hypothetical protein
MEWRDFNRRMFADPSTVQPIYTAPQQIGNGCNCATTNQIAAIFIDRPVRPAPVFGVGSVSTTEYPNHPPAGKSMPVAVSCGKTRRSQRRKHNGNCLYVVRRKTPLDDGRREEGDLRLFAWNRVRMV